MYLYYIYIYFKLLLKVFELLCFSKSSECLTLQQALFQEVGLPW